MTQPYFSLVEKCSLAQKVVVALIAFGILQDEGTSESSGRPCKDYTNTMTSSSSFPPTKIFGILFIPFTLLISLFLLSLGLLVGLGIHQLHTVYIRCFGMGNN